MLWWCFVCVYNMDCWWRVRCWSVNSLIWYCGLDLTSFSGVDYIHNREWGRAREVIMMYVFTIQSCVGDVGALCWFGNIRSHYSAFSVQRFRRVSFLYHHFLPFPPIVLVCSVGSVLLPAMRAVQAVLAPQRQKIMIRHLRPPPPPHYHQSLHPGQFSQRRTPSPPSTAALSEPD